MATPLYPTFEKRIKDDFEDLLRKQVVPWSFMAAGPPFRLNHFDGRPIAYHHMAFEGSPEHVFWSGYIEPFLEHLCVQSIESAVSLAKERDVDGRLLLLEVKELKEIQKVLVSIAASVGKLKVTDQSKTVN